jgi:hypothetical protein
MQRYTTSDLNVLLEEYTQIVSEAKTFFELYLVMDGKICAITIPKLQEKISASLRKPNLPAVKAYNKEQLKDAFNRIYNKNAEIASDEQVENAKNSNEMVNLDGKLSL